ALFELATARIEHKLLCSTNYSAANDAKFKQGFRERSGQGASRPRITEKSGKVRPRVKDAPCDWKLAHSGSLSPSVPNPMWAKGESSCQQFLDPSDDFWWRCRILNNGRRSAFVIDKRRVQDKGNCSCFEAAGKGHGCDCQGRRLQGWECWPSRNERSWPGWRARPLTRHSSQGGADYPGSVERPGRCGLERNRCRALMMPIATKPIP